MDEFSARLEKLDIEHDIPGLSMAIVDLFSLFFGAHSANVDINQYDLFLNALSQKCAGKVINWAVVVKNLDKDNFFIDSYPFFRAFIKHFNRISQQAFPASGLLTTGWKNAKHQLYLILFAANSLIPGEVDFNNLVSVDQRRLVGASQPPNLSWLCLSLYETLLDLATVHGYSEEVTQALINAGEHYPEYVCVLLAQCDMRFGGMRGKKIQNDVLDYVLPKFLGLPGSRHTSTEVIRWLSSINAEATLKLFRIALARSMSFEDVSQTCLRLQSLANSSELSKELEEGSNLQELLPLWCYNYDVFQLNFASKLMSLLKPNGDAITAVHAKAISDFLCKHGKDLRLQKVEYGSLLSYETFYILFSSLQRVERSLDRKVWNNLNSLNALQLYKQRASRSSSTTPATASPQPYALYLARAQAGGGQTVVSPYGTERASPMTPEGVSASDGASIVNFVTPDQAKMAHPLPLLPFATSTSSGIGGSGGIGDQVIGSGQMFPRPGITATITPHGSSPPVTLSDVEKDANTLFQQIYGRTISLEDAVHRMKALKLSTRQHEQEVFRCIIHNFFDEYRFFGRYNDFNLDVAANLMGMIINSSLVSSITLGIGLRYIIEAIRRNPADSEQCANMFFFGITAIVQLIGRLFEFNQYCSHLCQIVHFRELAPALCTEVELILDGRERNYVRQKAPVPSLSEIKQYFLQHQHRRQQVVQQQQLQQQQQTQQQHAQYAQQYYHHDAQHGHQQQQQHVSPWGAQQSFSAERVVPRPFPSMMGLVNSARPGDYSGYSSEAQRGHQGPYSGIPIPSAASSFTSHGMNEGPASDVRLPQSGTPTMMGMPPLAMTGLSGVLNTITTPQPKAALRVVLKGDLDNSNTGTAEREDKYPVTELPEEMKEQATKIGLGMTRQLSIKARLAIESQNEPPSPLKTLGLHLPNHYQDVLSDMVRANPNPLQAQSVEEKAAAAVVAVDLGIVDDDTEKSDTEKDGATLVDINSTSVTPSDRCSVAIVPSASDLTKDSIVVESSIKFGDTINASVLTEPSESLKGSVYFCMNNIGTDNIESKLLELRTLLREEHFNWFASYLVSNCVATQSNMQQMYQDLAESFDSKLMIKCILDHTYYNITQLLESDRVLSSSSDRLLLRNLGVWLGQLTLAKDKFLQENRCSLKKLICWAYENGRLIAVLGFCTRVLSGLKDSKVLRPPNPWVLGIFGLLRDLYEIDDLKLNLKFEVQVLCKNTDIKMEDVPPANLVDKLADPVGRVDGTNPDFNAKKKEKEKVVDEDIEIDQTVTSSTPMIDEVVPPSVLTASELSISQEIMRSVASSTGEKQLPPLTISSLPVIPNIADCVVFSEALPQLKTNVLMQRVTILCVDYAIRETLNNILERVCSFALKSVSYLLQKDYAGCNDHAKIRRAIKAGAGEVAFSYSSITAQGSLRSSLEKNLKNLAGVAHVDPQMQSGFVSVVTESNLEYGSNMVAKFAREGVHGDIDRAGDIVEFLSKASGAVSTADYLPEDKETKELIQAMPDYLKTPIEQLYADFAKIPEQQQQMKRQYQTAMSAVDNSATNAASAGASAKATIRPSVPVHSVSVSGVGGDSFLEGSLPGLMQPVHGHNEGGSEFQSSGSPRESGGSPRSPNISPVDSSPLDKVSGNATIDQYKIILAQMDEALDLVDKEAIASGKSMSMSQLSGDHLVLYLLRKLVVETQRIDSHNKVGIALLCAEELFRKVMFLSSPKGQSSASIKSDVLVGAIEALRDACGGVKKWMGVDTLLWLTKFTRVDVCDPVKCKIFVTCLSNLLRVKILSTDVLDRFFFDTIHNSGSNLKNSISIFDGSRAMLDETQGQEALQLGFLEVTLMFIKQVLCTGLANAFDFEQVFKWVHNAKPSVASVRKRLKELLQHLVTLAQAKEAGTLSTVNLEDGPTLMSLYMDHIVESSQKVSSSGGTATISSSTVLALLKKWQKKLESIPVGSGKRGKKKEKTSDKALDETFHGLLNGMQQAGIMQSSSTVDEFFRISIDLTCGNSALENAVGVHPLSVVFVKLINMADDETSREQLLRRILDAYLFSLLNAGDCIAESIFKRKYNSLVRILLDEICDVNTIRYFVYIITAICPSKLPVFGTAWINVVSHQKVFKYAVQDPQVRVALVPVISELLLFLTQENISELMDDVNIKKQWIAVMGMVCRILDADPQSGNALISQNCLEWLTLLPISIEGTLWISIRSLLTSCTAIGPITGKIDDLWIEKVLSPRYLKSILETGTDSLFVNENTVEYAVLHDESLHKSIKTVLKNCSDQQAIEMSVGSCEGDTTTSSMFSVFLSQLRIKTGDASSMQQILRLAINTAIKTASDDVSLSGAQDVHMHISGPPGLKSTGTLPASTISFIEQLLDTGFARFVSDLLRLEVDQVSPAETGVKKEYMKYTIYQLVLDHVRHPSKTSLIAVQALVMLLKDPGLKTADEHLLMRAILERALYRRKAKPTTSYVSWGIHLLLREVCSICSDLMTEEKSSCEFFETSEDEGEKDALSPASAVSTSSSQTEEAEVKEAAVSVPLHDLSSISTLLQKATKLALDIVGTNPIKWEPVF